MNFRQRSQQLHSHGRPQTERRRGEAWTPPGTGSGSSCDSAPGAPGAGHGGTAVPAAGTELQRGPGKAGGCGARRPAALEPSAGARPHLVQAQLRVIPRVLVPLGRLPVRLHGRLAAVGGLVRLALAQAAARVRVRKLGVPLLAAAATAAAAARGQHEALPHQQLDGVVQADVIVKEGVAVLHLQGSGTRSLVPDIPGASVGPWQPARALAKAQMCPRVRGQQNPPAPEGAHGRPFRRSPDPLGRGLLVSRDGPAGLWTHTGCPEAHAVRVLCSAALVTVNVSCLCHWLPVGAVLGGQRTATSGDVCGCRGWVRGPSCRQVGGAGTLQTPSAWDGPPRVPRPGMREPKEAPPPPSLPGRLELEFDPLRAPSRIQSPTLC